jgi:hypothetical protein
VKRSYKYYHDVVYTRRRKDRLRDVVVAEEAFSPDDISGLVLWLDADAIEGLNDGDPVTTWEDQSGNNNDATQSSASAKPTYQTNELNGKPIVRWDGTDDYMTLGDVAALDFGTNNFSVFIVVKATADEKAILVKDNFAGDGNGIYILSSDGDKYFYWNGAVGTSFGTRDASFHLLEAVRSGTGTNETTLYYDAVQATTLTDGRTLSNTIDCYVGADNDDSSTELEGDCL